MAAGKTAVREKQRFTIPPVAIVVGLVVLVGAAGFWFLDRASKRPPPEPVPLTGVAKEYAKYLKFVAADGHTAESPEMQKHENFFNQSVVEISGNLLNAGDRALNSVEIVLVFFDPYGTDAADVVLRERKTIISKKAGGLAPGEFRPFRLAFDDVPDSWNQAMPRMAIAAIEFR